MGIEIEPLEEGGYLATSHDLQGLVAQGRTVAETMEIAQDVAEEADRVLPGAWRPVAAGYREALTPTP